MNIYELKYRKSRLRKQGKKGTLRADKNILQITRGTQISSACQFSLGGLPPFTYLTSFPKEKKLDLF